MFTLNDASRVHLPHGIGENLLGKVLAHLRILVCKQREERAIILVSLFALLAWVLALLPVNLNGLADRFIILEGHLLNQLLIREERVLFEGLGTDRSSNRAKMAICQCQLQITLCLAYKEPLYLTKAISKLRASLGSYVTQTSVKLSRI